MSIPATKPKITRAQAETILREKGVAIELVHIAVVAVRGYYSTTFAPAGNNRGVYDDAACVVTESAFATFNMNVDPSVYRAGIATMKPGVVWYRKGIHGLSWLKGQYEAFRPATRGEQVPVTRDGSTVGNLTGTALNIHWGRSEGCQTLPKLQWPTFKNLLYSEMKREKVTRFPYVLVTLEEYNALLK